MLNWLAQIDPTVAITAVVALGGWLWHQARGDTQESLADLAKGVVEQAIQHALSAATGVLDGINPTNAADKIDTWVWAELAKHGIARNAAIELLVKPLIADAVARVLAELRARAEAALAKMPTDLANLSDRANAIVKLIDDAQAKGLAAGKKFADEMVEKVQ